MNKNINMEQIKARIVSQDDLIRELTGKLKNSTEVIQEVKNRNRALSQNQQDPSVLHNL